MTSPTTPPPTVADTDVALDAAGAIAVDVPCRRCGYNLRGLKPDGRCPECGTDVRVSLVTLLRAADPAWVRRLAHGAHRFHWCLLVVMAALLALHAMPALPDALQAALHARLPYLDTVLFGLLAVSGVGLMLAIDALTTPDPRPAAVPEHPWPREVARYSALLAILIPVGLLMLGGQWLAALILLTGVPTGWAALFEHLAALMRRVPDDGLGRQCRQVRRLAFLLLALGAATAAAMLLAPLSQSGETVFLCGLAVCALLAAVIAVRSIVIGRRIARVLAAQVRLAAARATGDTRA